MSACSLGKSKKEIMLIKKACKITDEIFKDLIKNFNFKTEKEVASFIRKKIREKNCKIAFRPIVASGRNASNPHHKPTDKKLNGFVIIDFGVKYKGYCSDMTRTVFIGKPTREQTRVYNLVLTTQKSAIKKIKKNIECKKIHEHVVKKLGKYRKYLIHSIGHGIGTKVHEKLTIGKKGKHVFNERMVFAIEPGIYIKNRFGIRIEDTLVMRKKPEFLTKSTKRFLTF